MAEKYDAELEDEDIDHFVIEVDGRGVGMIQTYGFETCADYAREIGEPVARAAGVDLFIGDPGAVGRGLGPR